MAKQSIYTVAQVNSYIKNMFTQDFMLRFILVKGEISNCKYHTSGHVYFTLKDEKGTLSCVMFKGARNGLSFRMEEGQQVVVCGTVDVYEKDGKYQLYAREIELFGAGVLYEKFERLKKELEERGMFAQEYKQKIPRYIRTLGVVTAPTGAVIQDIMNIALRRDPYLQIVLYPAIVQGDAAAESIANGIRALELHKPDVIIVGRGGGSIEDLWAFNEELVAQAIFDCSVPVISAVGHETDTTIADYVADLRAPTPSAAAELAVADREDMLTRIKGYETGLSGKMEKRLIAYQNCLDKYGLRFRALSPESRFREKRMLLLRLEESLQESMRQQVLENRHSLSLFAERLKGLSPLDKLKQGFSYVSDENGNTVNDVGKVKQGDELLIHVTNGKIHAKVTKTEVDTDGGKEKGKFGRAV